MATLVFWKILELNLDCQVCHQGEVRHGFLAISQLSGQIVWSDCGYEPLMLLSNNIKKMLRYRRLEIYTVSLFVDNL